MPKPRRKYGPKQRVPNDIMKRLEDARTAATLENASFGMPRDFVRENDEGKPYTKDAYIKKMVRLHHETWIIHPIDVAIAWAKGDE